MIFDVKLHVFQHIVMEDENFKQELEEFFRLFKRLMEKESLDGIPGVDQQQMEQIKTFMAQFENVKDELKIDMVHVDPFTKMMISTMVKQLREQLGPDLETAQPISAEEVVDQREEELKALSDESQRMVSLIETIDEQLKNPELSDAEIDALLDRRSRISSKLAEN